MFVCLFIVNEWDSHNYFLSEDTHQTLILKLPVAKNQRNHSKVVLVANYSLCKDSTIHIHMNTYIFKMVSLFQI